MMIQRQVRDEVPLRDFVPQNQKSLLRNFLQFPGSETIVLKNNLLEAWSIQSQIRFLDQYSFEGHGMAAAFPGLEKITVT